MRLSQGRLTQAAGETGFRPESLEKVFHLVGLLNAIFEHEDLRRQLVLKGGTAINLFLFEVPRLSVDIDLNYVGVADLDTMKAERPRLEPKLRAIFEQEGLTIRKAPDEHAGGKWQLRYPSASGLGGNLEVDLNYLLRVPLEPIREMDSHALGSLQARRIPVLGLSELVAGKLIALLDRSAPRDVYDAANLFAHSDLETERLRVPFVVYGAMSRNVDLRRITPNQIEIDPAECDRSLRPMLRQGAEALDVTPLITAVREGLGQLLPLRADEVAFVEALWDRGEIQAIRLTSDPELQARIEAMPGLQWKAQHVRKHRGL